MKKEKKLNVIGFRVTNNELNLIQSAAETAGKTTQDWIKEIALKTASQLSGELPISPSERVLLEQFTLLRIILTTTLADPNLTEEKLKKIIKKADAVKGDTAEKILKNALILMSERRDQ